MRYFLLPLLFIFFTIGASAQDTTGISFKNEIFPVYSGVKSRLGEGISFEVRKELATKSKLGIGYSKMTFGQHTSRNMELVFYKESDQENKVQVDLGFGFFVRQWSDVVNKDQSTEMYEQKSMTTGYVVSFGAKANLSSSVAFATRLLVNNNTNFDLTYSLRPGIIISIQVITSKPRTNTITALSVFLILVFIAFFMLLHSLLTNESFFILKLILTPIVLTIGLILLGKVLGSVKVVRFGDKKIEVFYPIVRQKVKINLTDILGWREEVINTKNGEFREVKILYTKKKILKLSNKENTEYEKVVKYLKRKIKVKKN